jgi:hypothetical protein
MPVMQISMTLPPLWRLLLWRERARVAARIAEWRGLADIPHEIGEIAAARIARLARRLAAIERLSRRAARPPAAVRRRRASAALPAGAT